LEVDDACFAVAGLQNFGMLSRWRNFAFSIGIFAVILFAGRAAETKVVPRHDPPDQLFRRAPMAESARSIVVNLATNLHVAFDTERGRIHTIWKGGPLNLWGPPYSNAKTPFICDFEGERVYTFPQVPVWSSMTWPWPIEFKGIRVTNGLVQLEYGAGSGAEVREILAGAVEGSDWAVHRKLHLVFRTHGEDPYYLLFAEGGARIEGEKPLKVTGTNGVMYVTIESDAGEVVVDTVEAEYSEEIVTEAGTEKGNPKVERRGPEARIYVKIPKEKTTGRISVMLSSSAEPIATRPTPRQKPTVYEGERDVRKNSGDEFYTIEHFPLPSAAELIITGMDWLNDRDLAVCTWLGEIYIVENATGPVREAKYRRFARGLNEPLGLTVHKGEIYVVQKGELTRVEDTDRDGEADWFDCVSDDWGYSGNYHSYSFGPLVMPNNDMMVFTTGQRARADLEFQGAALLITAEREGWPFCGGLRVPHGWGSYQGDIFVTDNQGNWIGTCKLNHIETNKFYGFQREGIRQKFPRTEKEVAPPALWLPRALSPSASGIETIDAEAFGAFKGQMLIGDFQNSIVMRAFLEKVNGNWQGAVFPFAKGFLSGVNRLSMGADGKLYVGGGKRTWSTAAPKEYSLDRVSYTGKLPFEVSEVHALKDGFELRFTKALELEPARDAENYLVKQFGYKYHEDYGSPEFDHEGKVGATELEVEHVEVAEDRKSVRLKISGLKTGFVTSFQLAVNSADDEDLQNDTFYYTLNQQPK
jgi:glucose/arabinose dehydrogenase